MWSVSSNTASPVSSVVYERLALSQYGEHSKHVNVNIHVQENEKPNNPQLGSLKHHTNGHTYKATSHTTLCLRLSKNAERGRAVTGQGSYVFSSVPVFLFALKHPETLHAQLHASPLFPNLLTNPITSDLSVHLLTIAPLNYGN